MFKSARWRSEKNKVKIVFKLQFHAAKLPQIGDDALMISVVPADAGKPTVKSDKASVRDGSCLWENPVYESVKFSRDSKSGKVHERIYYFVVGTSSSKSGVIGEASIDFANYAEATKVSMVSLPLKCSKPEAVLNVSIQRMQQQESIDHSHREFEEKEDAKSVNSESAKSDYSESAKSNYKDRSLKAQLDNGDIDGTTIEVNPLIRTRSEEVHSDGVLLNKTVSNISEPKGIHRASSGSDITMSSSESDNVHHEWLRNSTLEAASTDDSLSTPREGESFLGRHHHLEEQEESSDIFIEKLKSEVTSLSRQAEMSELELQTLRKQIVKESKRGQDLFKEVGCLKEERDALKAECGKIKTANTRNNNMQSKGDCWEIVEELRQEINHAKEINSNLQIQLQKTQESNAELILAVRDLDEILEHKNNEISNGSLKIVTGPRNDENDDDDHEEQKALEELVKEHGDAKEACLLEQQIIDLRGEIEIYKRDRDDLEMQMEQLALDYEIMKQENHEMAYKLEQSEIQEQLKMQYECSSEYTTVQELENQIDNLDIELKKRSEESEAALAKISELEARVESLEEELEKQSEGFEADLEALVQLKIKQEQRALRAEEALRKTKRQNANTAERIQEEFKRLSVQVGSTFEANEKVAAKALVEAKGLRIQKWRLVEIIKNASEEQKTVKRSLMDQIEKLQLEIVDKALQLENHKKDAEETRRLLSDEISKLKDEISNQTLMDELERMRMLVKDMELLLKQGDDEKTELKNRITLLKGEAEELKIELNKMRCVVEEKELNFEKVQSELDFLQSECMELKSTVSEYGLEKDLLRKQLFLFKGDLKRKDDLLNDMEKKSTLVANFKEKIKLFEDHIKTNESALETSYNAFLDKEKELYNNIGVLEGRLEVLDQGSVRCCENEVRKAAALAEDQNSNLRTGEEARNCDEDSTNRKICAGLCLSSNGNSLPDALKRCADNTEHLDELSNEMGLLKKRNQLMEVELKEMQERYSEISVKFAEVEGERQQLVMRVRNLKNARKDRNQIP